MEFEILISIGYLLLTIFQIWVYMNLKSYTVKNERTMA